MSVVEWSDTSVVLCWCDARTGVVGCEWATTVRPHHIIIIIIIIRQQQWWASSWLRSHHLWRLQLTSAHVAIPTVVTCSHWWRHTRQTPTHLPISRPGHKHALCLSYNEWYCCCSASYLSISKCHIHWLWLIVELLHFIHWHCDSHSMSRDIGGEIASVRTGGCSTTSCVYHQHSHQQRLQVRHGKQLLVVFFYISGSLTRFTHIKTRLGECIMVQWRRRCDSFSLNCDTYVFWLMQAIVHVGHVVFGLKNCWQLWGSACDGYR